MGSKPLLHESAVREPGSQWKLRREILLTKVKTIWLWKRLPKECIQSGEPWVESGIGNEIGTYVTKN